jgi:outer membrane scaffolding protein for murein synthesis (MipA/OmpV family)
VRWLAAVLSFAALLLAGVFLGAAAARAQTPTPLMFWQYSSGEVLAPIGKDAPKWRILLGPSPMYMPKYEGSSHYVLEPGIALDIRYRERLFLSVGEGLGYDVFRTRDYRIGAAVAYDVGRNDHPGPIHGIGDIHPAPEAKFYAEYVFRPMLMGYEVPVILSGDVRKAFGGYDGVTGDLGLYMPVAGSEEKRFFVFAGPGVSLANNRTMNSYFSINRRQSSRSGLRTYDADGGLRSAGFGISSGWFFTPHWLVSANGSAKRQLGDSADSPIVQDKWQFAASLTLAYMWF